MKYIVVMINKTNGKERKASETKDRYTAEYRKVMLERTLLDPNYRFEVRSAGRG